MDKKAVELARRDYDHAVASLADMKVANDFPTIERHWTAFLVNAGRVFTKLEQGAKTVGKSDAWFGRKKRERRTDPLLCYLWHARNADEHTLQQVTKLNPGHAKVTQVNEIDSQDEEFVAIQRQMDIDGRPYAILGKVEGVWPHPELLDVVDKGVRFKPPALHLDQPLINTSPAHIGDLAMEYLDGMLTQAAQLAT